MAWRAVLFLVSLPTFAESLNATRSTEQHLQIIDAYLAKVPRSETGLLQTYGPSSFGGGSCGEYCSLPEPCPNYESMSGCRFDVYDNALAAIYLTHRGKLADAKQILDAFVYYLYPGSAVPHAYIASSGRYMTLMAAAYLGTKSSAGVYEGSSVADGAPDLGNHAFAGMAFAHYAAASGDSCMSTVAHDLIGVLSDVLGCDDALGGFMGRTAPFTGHYRSIEHNIDMVGFASMLGNSRVEQQARTFVKSMYGKSKVSSDTWAIGTGGSHKCDPEINQASPVVTDGQMWNVAAGADDNSTHARTALAFALGGLFESDIDYIGHGGNGVGEEHFGFRFSTFGNGIQWENSAAAVVALSKFRLEQGDAGLLDDTIEKVQNSLKRLLEVYGSVPASILGGNYQRYSQRQHSYKYPGGSDTGLGWTYLRYPHLASTMWSGFALLGANPYALRNQVPAPGDASCLPTPAPAPTPAPMPSPVPVPAPMPSPVPVPAPMPSPVPGATCNVGDAVDCPGGTGRCAGGQCCPGGITCPSAPASFDGCPTGKTVDCTGQFLGMMV